jgi:hypothetical protein
LRIGARVTPSKKALDAALYVTAALVVLAFGALLVDLIRDEAWLDVVLLIVGSAFVALCFVLQRWTRSSTG